MPKFSLEAFAVIVDRFRLLTLNRGSHLACLPFANWLLHHLQFILNLIQMSRSLKLDEELERKFETCRRILLIQNSVLLKSQFINIHPRNTFQKYLGTQTLKKKSKSKLIKKEKGKRKIRLYIEVRMCDE